MTDLLLYAIKSAIVLTLLYLPYMLMLRNEKFFRFNRVMLLAILVCSLFLPLCNIPFLSLDEQPVVKVAQQQMIDVGIPIRQAATPEMIATPAEEEEGSVSWFTIVSIIYIVGMAVVLTIRLIQFLRMGIVIKGGSLWKETRNGINIYCHADNVVPFSWLNNIVINKGDYDTSGHAIILHETGHIRCNHSADIILLTFVQMLQWCNPLVYILGTSLRDLHEYEADDYVLNQGITLRNYQEILIKKAVGASSYTFANNFNHSLIKKRITMMYKKNSNPWRRGKALYALPMVAVALCAFATPKFITPIEEAVNNLEDKGTPKFWNVKAESKENAETVADTCSAVLDRIEFKGEEFAGMGVDAENTSIFVDDKEISFEKLQKLDPKTIASVTVFGKDSGRFLFGDNVKNTVIVIKTKDYQQKAESDSNTPAASDMSAEVLDDDPIFEICEVVPEYKEGQAALMQHFMKSMRYPKLAQEAGVSGRVLVKFIVEKDGTLSNFEIQNPKGKELDNKGGITVTAYEGLKKEYTDEQIEAAANKALEDEAIRAVQATSGKWKPGKQRGKDVRSRFTLPITFRLQ